MNIRVRHFLKPLFPVLLVALVASILHIAPYWRALDQTPPGWTFTWNTHTSPDYMQYRVWSRQTQHSGIIVSNKFTSEPNKPYLIVLPYYIIGVVSDLLQVSPEYVYAYAGSIFAFIFVLLLYFIVHIFIQSPYQRWWIFLIMLFAGGISTHLRLLSQISFIRNSRILQETLIKGLWSQPTFEDYRGNWIFQAFFDTHFLLIWLITTLAIISLYFTLKKFTFGRALTTGVLYSLTIFLHIYEGITLFIVTLTIILLLWMKKKVSRTMFVTFLVCSFAITFSFILYLGIHQSSGLPDPSWRGVNILFSTFMISYPLAWGLIAFGILGYWKNAGFNEIFLVGWTLGCTIIVLSGPFYPFPDRGTMTLQIPLYIIAGAIYFTHFRRINLIAAVLIVIIGGLTPAWILQNKWEQTAFNPNSPAIFESKDHRVIIDTLKEYATEEDILIADMNSQDWETDQLWLAPEYPGKLYCGHFFLTVEYERKRAECINFYRNELDEKTAFLRDKGIHFVYVDSSEDLRPFEEIPGLKILASSKVGAIFEYNSSSSVNP